MADTTSAAWSLLFGIRRSVRYHMRRQRFFDRLDRAAVEPPIGGNVPVGRLVSRSPGLSSAEPPRVRRSPLDVPSPLRAATPYARDLACVGSLGVAWSTGGYGTGIGAARGQGAAVPASSCSAGSTISLFTQSSAPSATSGGTSPSLTAPTRRSPTHRRSCTSTRSSAGTAPDTCWCSGPRATSVADCTTSGRCRGRFGARRSRSSGLSPWADLAPSSSKLRGRELGCGRRHGSQRSSGSGERRHARGRGLRAEIDDLADRGILPPHMRVGTRAARIGQRVRSSDH